MLQQIIKHAEKCVSFCVGHLGKSSGKSIVGVTGVSVLLEWCIYIKRSFQRTLCIFCSYLISPKHLENIERGILGCVHCQISPLDVTKITHSLKWYLFLSSSENFLKWKTIKQFIKKKVFKSIYCVINPLWPHSLKSCIYKPATEDDTEKRTEED